VLVIKGEPPPPPPLPRCRLVEPLSGKHFFLRSLSSFSHRARMGAHEKAWFWVLISFVVVLGLG